MNRKTVVMLSVLGIVLFAVLAWGLILLFRSERVPPFATVEAIELNYGRQIHRLLQLAQNSQLIPSITFNDPADVVLFKAPEILEARVASSPYGGSPLGSKLYNFKSRFSVLPRQPSLGIAVVNRHWDTLPNGNKLTVLEYHRCTRDDQGAEVGVILVLDLSLLERKAAKRAPHN